MAKYKISPKAINDLSDIWEYTFSQWSKSQADIYHNLLIKQIEVLASNPLHGIARDFIRKGYRSFPVKSHNILQSN